MTRAFRDGEDIHRTTAALVHGVDPAEVSDSLRREAKALNFGIIYGMGAYGLAQATDMDQKQAAQFIKDYLAKFSGVAKYMEDMKNSRMRKVMSRLHSAAAGRSRKSNRPIRHSSAVQSAWRSICRSRDWRRIS